MNTSFDMNPQKVGSDFWLTGKLLVAMPNVQDPRFARSVVFVCSHGPSGAMGLVVNRHFGDLNFVGLLKQLDIKLSPGVAECAVHFGGPVEPGRGFVLHSTDYVREGTMSITDQASLTATVEVLHDLASGGGPHRAMLALGYAGWGAGQLETEMQANGWLVAPATDDILFGPNLEAKWLCALSSIGVNPQTLSGEVGHA